jgi:hypothetical protein
MPLHVHLQLHLRWSRSDEVLYLVATAHQSLFSNNLEATHPDSARATNSFLHECSWWRTSCATTCSWIQLDVLVARWNFAARRGAMDGESVLEGAARTFCTQHSAISLAQRTQAVARRRHPAPGSRVQRAFGVKRER